MLQVLNGDASNIGDYSIAMGNGTIASGSSSVSLGGSTTASGSGSISLGVLTVASGDYSVALVMGPRPVLSVLLQSVVTPKQVEFLQLR